MNRSDFEQTADASIQIDCAGRRFSDARKDLEQGAFAGAVAAMMRPASPNQLRSDVAHAHMSPWRRAHCRSNVLNGALERVRQRVAQGPVALTLANAVLLANIRALIIDFILNDRRRSFSMRRNQKRGIQQDGDA